MHVPLSAVPAALTRDVMDGTIDLAAGGLRRFGIPHPRSRLLVSILMRERKDLLGDEERTVIRPAIEAGRARASRTRPVFPRRQTVFVRATKGEFDAVIACYHDQV